VARNRKRAKERRRTDPASGRPADLLEPASRRSKRPADPRRPTSGWRAADGAAGALGVPDIGVESVQDPDAIASVGPVGAPDPIAHAAPDAEVAAARIALGAPDEDDVAVAGDEELAELATSGGGRRGGGGAGGNGAGEVAVPHAGGRAAAHRASLIERLLTFLRGSWAELQRVQWPDRRQVIQATGVVIGFVIVAGVFLGLSDLASSHLMDWILK
jgi:preprotein translocase subunit SecE